MGSLISVIAFRGGVTGLGVKRADYIPFAAESKEKGGTG
jgi:hypothetical protein